MASTIDDDSFIDSILDTQAAREGKATTSRGPKMSSNRKDMIKGKKGVLVPAITKEEADSITEWNNLKKAQAEFKLKHGKQGLPFDALKQEGNSLKVNEDLIKERNLNDDRLLKQMQVEDKNSSNGVAHFVTGETVVLGRPEDVKRLEQGEGQEIVSERIKGTHGEVEEEGNKDVNNKG